MKPAQDHEKEHAAEAKRMRQLPRADQRVIVDMHRADADNPKVPKADRDYARQRFRALTRLLKLDRKK